MQGRRTERRQLSPQALFDSGLVKDRKEIFITATLEQNDFHRVSSAIEQTLTNLGTDYVDLLLMNWPDVGCGNDNPEGRSRIWRCARSFRLSLAI